VALSSPTARHVSVDGQLTERRPPKPLLSGGTTVALDHVQRAPFQLAAAAMPCAVAVVPTAMQRVGLGQLTPMSRSTPVLPASSTAGALQRQDLPTRTPDVVIA
jgi:hypothetical protein